jgi:hypothetical protein
MKELHAFARLERLTDFSSKLQAKNTLTQISESFIYFVKTQGREV